MVSLNSPSPPERSARLASAVALLALTIAAVPVSLFFPFGGIFLVAAIVVGIVFLRKKKQRTREKVLIWISIAIATLGIVFIALIGISLYALET